MCSHRRKNYTTVVDRRHRGPGPPLNAVNSSDINFDGDLVRWSRLALGSVHSFDCQLFTLIGSDSSLLQRITSYGSQLFGSQSVSASQQNPKTHKVPPDLTDERQTASVDRFIGSDISLGRHSRDVIG